MGRTDLARIDAKVQRGNAKAARKLGETYDVYRLSNATSGTGIVSGTPIASNVFAIFERLTSKAEIEIESSVKALYYTSTLNALPFQAGDVFVQRRDSYRFVRAVYTLAQVLAMPREPVFIATPIYATLSLPESNPQHTDSGRVPQSVPIKAHEWPLTLADGSFSFQQTGMPVTVPIGMVMSRLRDYPRSDTSLGELWDDTRRQTWDAFLPILPGQPIIPRVMVTGANGDRYEVTGVQTSTASFFGQLVTLQRDRS